MSKCINIINNISINNIKTENSKSNNNSNINPTNKLKDIMKTYLNNKYGSKSDLKYQYSGLVMQNLIFNKNTHLVSVFKDYMIVDYIEEFLKRYYKINESHYKVPKFFLFYKNYLKFFCEPTLKNLYINNLIHNRCEKKAEFFYNENYKNKKNNTSSSSEQNNGLYEDSDSSEKEEDNENSLNSNIFFDDDIRKKIEKYSPINTSIVLPESGSKFKKSESFLLITDSNEESLFNIMHGINKERLSEISNINSNIKFKTKVNSVINFLLNDNKKKNEESQNKSPKKFKNDKIKKNSNFENSNNNDIYKKKFKEIELKKIGSQNLKILLNKNNGILKSKSNKKLIKKNGLFNLLKEKGVISIKSQDYNNTNNNTNIINDLTNNKQNTLIINKNPYINKNSNLSHINLSKKKSIMKSRSKLSPEIKNKNIIKNKKQNQKYYNNNNNLTNNSNYNTFDKNDIKRKSYNYINISKKNFILKNCGNNSNKNLIDSILNKIKTNAINSNKKRTLNRQKMLLRKQHKKNINLTRNGTINRIGTLGLTNNNYIYPNNSKQNITNSNKNYKNSCNNELRSRSNKNKNFKFFNSPSSILDFLKKTKFQRKIKKNFKNNQLLNNKSNYIHNVNININNQINIKFNHLKELTSFIGHNKKNKIIKETNTRNKNRSLDINAINQNIIINNTFLSNYNKKKSNLPNVKNNRLYGFKYKNVLSRNNKLYYNIESLMSNNKDNRIRNHHYSQFLNSLKSLNNNSKI